MKFVELLLYTRILKAAKHLSLICQALVGSVDTHSEIYPSFSMRKKGSWQALTGGRSVREWRQSLCRHGAISRGDCEYVRYGCTPYNISQYNLLRSYPATPCSVTYLTLLDDAKLSNQLANFLTFYQRVVILSFFLAANCDSAEEVESLERRVLSINWNRLDQKYKRRWQD